jgi:hypothetical protein
MALLTFSAAAIRSPDEPSHFVAVPRDQLVAAAIEIGEAAKPVIFEVKEPVRIVERLSAPGRDDWLYAGECGHTSSPLGPRRARDCRFTDTKILGNRRHRLAAKRSGTSAFSYPTALAYGRILFRLACVPDAGLGTRPVNPVITQTTRAQARVMRPLPVQNPDDAPPIIRPVVASDDNNSSSSDRRDAPHGAQRDGRQVHHRWWRWVTDRLLISHR